MNALARFFAIDLCLRFKRLNWNADHAEKLVDSVIESRKK